MRIHRRPPHAVPTRRPAARAARLAVVAVAGLAAAGCGRIWPRTGSPGAPGTPGGEPAPAEKKKIVLPPPTTGPELVLRMNQRWVGRWYRTLQFRQENTVTTAAGGEQKSTWMEYQVVPGKLRIDFLPATQKSGVLFLDNVQRTYTSGKLTDTRRLVHGLLALGADVYAVPPEQTMRALDSLKIDETKFYATRGVRQMYIVGAAPGDTSSNQFWVDADSLLLRRFVQRTTNRGRTTVSDTRFTYQDVDGFPVPREVVFLRNGRPYLRELYTEVRVNAPLPEELFDPALWGTATRP